MKEDLTLIKLKIWTKTNQSVNHHAEITVMTNRVSKADPSMDNSSVVQDMFVCFIGVFLSPGMNRGVAVNIEVVFLATLF